MRSNYYSDYRSNSQLSRICANTFITGLATMGTIQTKLFEYHSLLNLIAHQQLNTLQEDAVPWCWPPSLQYSAQSTYRWKNFLPLQQQPTEGEGASQMLTFSLALLYSAEFDQQAISSTTTCRTRDFTSLFSGTSDSGAHLDALPLDPRALAGHP